MVKIYEKLEKVVSKEVISDNMVIRHAYSRNIDPYLHSVPDIVIRPKDAQEISEILKIANEENIAVIPRGAGACEAGGSKPIGDGGIVLDLKRLDNIINLDEENLVVTVEAGISWSKLNEYLSHYGLYTGCMGPGSGMIASIGGGMSHHSTGGGGAAKYGTCTNHLISLEVVLPTGEIIETGSQSSKYSKFPFTRFSNGPDLAGLFCGDNGIFGIKTKVSLRVFPRPPFSGYKTYFLPRKDIEVSAEIFSETRHKGIDVYDMFYIMGTIVNIGAKEGLYPLFDRFKRKRGVMFYTVEANTETELDEKIKQLDQIFLDHKCEDLGEEISDGNYAKWHYEEQGHWMIYHNLWGFKPAVDNVVATCRVPIKMYPQILYDLDQWDMEHAEDMKKVLEITGLRPVTGSGPIFLVEDHDVIFDGGFSSPVSYYDGKYYEEIEDIGIKLWKSVIERIGKYGVSYYMMGDMLSRTMVEMDGYASEYYNFMKMLKKTLDPNFILSRGKFKFGGG